MEQQAAEGPREFLKGPPGSPGIAKTHSTHSQRLTAVMASENVTSCFPAQSTPRTPAYRLGNWLTSPPPGVRPEQAGGRTKHRLLLPTPCRLQSQVRAHFLEGSFFVPAAHVGLDHFCDRSCPLRS